MNKDICILCEGYWTIAARGLCSRCYPKERVKGRLQLYEPKRDQWKKIADEVIKLYQGGMIAKQIGKCFDISETKVLNILRRYNVPRRRTGYARIYQLNEYVFDELNLQGAYWLGFIYADGHAKYDGLMVQLHRKDRDQIKRLREFLGSNAPIVDRTNTGFGIETEVSHIKFNNAYLVRRLQELGITTGRGNFQSVTKVLTPKLYNHFICGYLDGDGSIYKYPRVKFSGQQDILEWISHIIANSLDISERKLYPNKSIFQIVYNGRHQAPRVAEWIYQNVTTSMPRKYERYLQWEKT